MTHPLVVINKSTVPVGTGDWVAEIIRSHLAKPLAFSVVSCPEFLREGSALTDFLGPARTVLGSMDREAADKVAQLHLPLRAPIVITDLRTAEMIKYASNAFLATKISFINEIANICEALGADVKEVASGMGYDPRIGRQFLEAGIGYGGSCFPKDVKALAYMASVQGRNPQLLQAVMDINEDRRRMVIEHVESLAGNLKGAEIGLLGLAFKSNTDDMREAPALRIAALLRERGAKVRAYDPVAMEGAARIAAGRRNVRGSLRAGRRDRRPGGGDRLERIQTAGSFEHPKTDAETQPDRRAEHLRTGGNAPARIPLPRNRPRIQRAATAAPAPAGKKDRGR